MFPSFFSVSIIVFFYLFAPFCLEAAKNDPVEKAERLEKDKKYADAAKIWEELVKEEPDNAEYLYRLGRLNAWTGRYPEAEAQLKAALELNPRNADAKLILANLYLWTGRPEKAKELYEQILEDYPKYKEAQEGLAKVEESEKLKNRETFQHIMEGQKEIVLTFPKQLKEQEEQAAEEAELLEKRKEYAQAEKIWEYLLKQEPESAYFLYRLGRIYAWTGKYPEAEKLLNHSLQLNPKDADVKVSLAYLYFWTKREDLSRELFNEVLKSYPGYEDAKKGLAKLDESAKEKAKERERLAKQKEEKEKEEKKKKEEEPKEDEFSKWQREWIKQAECYEKCEDYDRALLIWCHLFNTVSEVFECAQADQIPKNAIEKCLTKIGIESFEKQLLAKHGKTIENRTKIIAFRLGQVLSWQGHWDKAVRFLHYALAIDPKYDEAWLRLGYVALFSGGYEYARQVFWYLISKNLKKPDPDAVEAFARASQALTSNSAARRAFAFRLYQPQVNFPIVRNYYYVLKWTDPWLKGILFYGQERETDLITKVRSAQRNTFFSSLAYFLPMNDKNRLFFSGWWGSEREINLVAHQDNFSVLEKKYSVGYDSLLNPWLALRSWFDFKEGRDIGHPLFPLGSRKRAEPGVILTYTHPRLVSFVSAIRDSFIVKRFADFKSTFLLRDTYMGQVECNYFNGWAFTGLQAFYSYYHESPLNRQWEGQGWATLGYPRYNPCLFVNFRARVGGFKFTQTDYYSYKRQWEYFAKVFYVKQVMLNTDLDIGYHRSWQWSRALNQPINTAIFVPRLYRSTHKAYAELRHLYRPNICLIFRTEYYTDSTEYQAWSTRGEAHLIF